MTGFDEKLTKIGKPSKTGQLVKLPVTDISANLFQKPALAYA